MLPANELVQLVCFVQAAEAGSIAGAAVRIGMGQAAVSSNLRKLEANLGTSLLERTRRGLSLTPAGETFVIDAREIVRRASLVRGDMRRYGKAVAGALRIGLPPIPAHVIAAGLMRFASREHPDVQVAFLEGYSSDVRGWLEAGSIDLGLFDGGSGRDLPFAHPVATEELLVVGSAHLVPLSGGDVEIGDVFDLPLVLPGMPHGHRLAIERLANEARRKLNVVLEVDSLPALLGVLRLGECVGLLPRAALPSGWAAQGMTAAPVRGRSLTRTLMMGTPVRRPISRVARKFLPVVDILCGALDMGDRAASASGIPDRPSQAIQAATLPLHDAAEPEGDILGIPPEDA